jgi:plastin-1
MELLGSKSEKDIMNWITEKAKPVSPITKWKDSQFSDGKILIKLAEVIEPRNVNWDYFSEEDTDEAREMNAKYAISLARKLGAVIFLAWDDIPDLNPKMLLVFCASLYDIYMQVHGDDKAEEKKEE